MTDNTESETESASPAQWTPAVTEPPAQFPDSVTAADGPFAWTNDNTGRGLRIEHNDATGQLDDWIVTGETARIGPRLLQLRTTVVSSRSGQPSTREQQDFSLVICGGLQPVRKAD